MTEPSGRTEPSNDLPRPEDPADRSTPPGQARPDVPVGEQAPVDEGERETAETIRSIARLEESN